LTRVSRVWFVALLCLLIGCSPSATPLSSVRPDSSQPLSIASATPSIIPPTASPSPPPAKLRADLGFVTGCAAIPLANKPLVIQSETSAKAPATVTETRCVFAAASPDMQRIAYWVEIQALVGGRVWHLEVFDVANPRESPTLAWSVQPQQTIWATDGTGLLYVEESYGFGPTVDLVTIDLETRERSTVGSRVPSDFLPIVWRRADGFVAGFGRSDPKKGYDLYLRKRPGAFEGFETTVLPAQTDSPFVWAVSSDGSRALWRVGGSLRTWAVDDAPTANDYFLLRPDASTVILDAAFLAGISDIVALLDVSKSRVAYDPGGTLVLAALSSSGGLRDVYQRPLRAGSPHLKPRDRSSTWIVDGESAELVQLDGAVAGVAAAPAASVLLSRDGSSPPPRDPVAVAPAVVRSFYRAIEQRDYVRAFEMLSSDWRHGTDLDQFTAGYANSRRAVFTPTLVRPIDPVTARVTGELRLLRVTNDLPAGFVSELHYALTFDVTWEAPWWVLSRADGQLVSGLQVPAPYEIGSSLFPERYWQALEGQSHIRVPCTYDRLFRLIDCGTFGRFDPAPGYDDPSKTFVLAVADGKPQYVEPRIAILSRWH